MRHLDRSTVAEPACLSGYSPNDDWCALARTPEHYTEVVDRLGEIQRQRCAYCECDLTNESKNPHIEHFEQRSRVRQKTFVWSNLFWSCSHEERCGKHKDHVVGSYRPGDLLKPDLDKPRKYLFFTRDGGVGPRPKLDAAENDRAKETIRVFALDDRRLVAERRAVLVAPYSVAQAVAEAELTDDESRRYLADEAPNFEGCAFSAAVLDVLGIEP